MKSNKKMIVMGIVIIIIIGILIIFFPLRNRESKEKVNDSTSQECNTTENNFSDITENKVGNTTENTTEKILENESQITETTKILKKQMEDVFKFENGKESIAVEVHSELTEPGKGKLKIESIAGFISDNKYVDNNTNTNPDINNSEINLSVDNITADAVGAYTGNYIEDGSDEPIENVASIIVTNHSNKMLQIADIEFKVNANDVAKFRVTNLLSGASALVLESAKRLYNEDDDYSYGTVATSWIDSVSIQEDKFSITKEDGLLSLKNKTDKSYQKVYVYYKYMQVGGAYMGGITYRVPFMNVAPNSTIESIANHFNKETSKIVDVQIVE